MRVAFSKPSTWRFASSVWMVAFALGTADTARSDSYQQHRNIVYHETHGVGLVMDVFAPTETPNGRAIIQVVSGGWSSSRGKIRDLKRALTFEIFCKRGYTVFAIRPGSLSKFSAPEMVDHIETGIRWVKKNADEYQIDRLRIGLMGASAGGHIACLVAVQNGTVPSRDTASVQAVGVFFPPTNFLDFGGRKIDPRETDNFSQMLSHLAFQNGEIEKSEEALWKKVTAISPARLVTENTPPFLLIHGDADKIVPLQQSETMLTALQAKGIDSQLIVKKGGGHPWLTIPNEIIKMTDWFDQKLKHQ